MKARYYLLGCFALAACDPQQQLETEGPVVANFAQPFPASSPDLPVFLPRDRHSYTAPDEPGAVLVLGEKALVKRYVETLYLTGSQLDSMKLPRRAGGGVGKYGLHYRVQALAADSFRLRAETLDTLLSLAGPRAPRLRYYQGAYYTSSPSLLDSTKWSVRRLAIANGQLSRQVFNPDSLRVRVLAPTIVQQHHTGGQLLLTLSPQSRRDIEQVASYAGLWLGPAEWPHDQPRETQQP